MLVVPTPFLAPITQSGSNATLIMAHSSRISQLRDAICEPRKGTYPLQRSKGAQVAAQQGETQNSLLGLGSEPPLSRRRQQHSELARARSAIRMPSSACRRMSRATSWREEATLYIPAHSAVYCPSHQTTESNLYLPIVEYEVLLVMPTSELSEFELIARLTSQLPPASEVVQGVGDDAAVLNCPPGSQLIATCDALVEGRHFLRVHTSAEQIGRRALAVNLSDLAAMGGEPRFALVSLILPPATEPTWLDDLYRGLLLEANEFGVAIVGGNIAVTDGPLIIDITLLGVVAQGKAVLRSGAHVGDRVCVTGTLGAAAAGLLSFLKPFTEAHPALDQALDDVQSAQRVPRPRVAEGRALAASGLVTAMLDISDGLAGDLGHICERSGVGAVIEAGSLPISASTVQIATAHQRTPRDLALFGGEDYELLFTVPDNAVDQALAAVRAAGGSAVAIGWIVPAESGPSITLRLRLPDGTERPLAPRGWDHLHASPS